MNIRCVLLPFLASRDPIDGSDGGGMNTNAFPLHRDGSSEAFLLWEFSSSDWKTLNRKKTIHHLMNRRSSVKFVCACWSAKQERLLVMLDHRGKKKKSRRCSAERFIIINIFFLQYFICLLFFCFIFLRFFLPLKFIRFDRSFISFTFGLSVSPIQCRNRDIYLAAAAARKK